MQVAGIKTSDKRGRMQSMILVENTVWTTADELGAEPTIRVWNSKTVPALAVTLYSEMYDSAILARQNNRVISRSHQGDSLPCFSYIAVPRAFLR